MSSMVRIPSISASTTEVVIQQWLVAEGDEVSVGDAIAELETEKASVELISETAGVVSKLNVQEGDVIAVGEVAAVIGSGAPEEAESGSVPDAPEASPVSRPSEGAGAVESHAPRVFSSPLARKLAKDRGIDLETLSGSGPGGRVTRIDIEAVMLSRAEEPRDVPVVETPIEPVIVHTVEAAETAQSVMEVSRLRKLIARRMNESKPGIPHFYLKAECQADAVLAFRERLKDLGAKLSVNDFIIKSVAKAMQSFPEFNRIWNEDSLIQFTEVDVSVAVASENGLVTPVVRNAGGKSLGTISADVKELIDKANDGRLREHELSGGAIAVSNLGMYGIQEFTAIINPPQSAILSVGAIRDTPVVRDGQLEVAKTFTVILSVDHRVSDGALAAQWLQEFVTTIERPELLAI